MPSNHVGPVDELGRPLDLDGGFIAGAGGDAVGDDDGRAGGAVSGVVIESSRMDEPDDDDLPPLEEEDKHQYLDLPHLEAVHNTGTRKFLSCEISLLEVGVKLKIPLMERTQRITP